jgi:cobalt-zinc-cadmium efflux system outer membrane protein
MTRYGLVGSAMVLLVAGTARGDGPRSLTFDDVVELARSRAPAVRLADAEVAVERGRRAGARVLVADNPVLSGGVGSRWADERTTDRELSLSVPIELGGQRGKRTAAADADIRVARARAGDVRRRAAGLAAGAYFEALFARELLALAGERRALAERLVDTARERKLAGDAAELEVNLATGELSRARSGVASARRWVARARTRLATVLGLGSVEGVTVAGALDDWSFVRRDRGAAVGDRADVRVARARVSAASAQVELADARRWPALSFQLTYAHEESADIAFGGVAVTLPLFERGQGERAEARASRHRAELEVELTERAATAEVEGARKAYVAAVAAVDEMKSSALPLAIENERMARDSYAAGKIELAALLVVRREALDTRAEYLDRRLEAALAAVDLWVAQGAPE